MAIAIPLVGGTLLEGGQPINGSYGYHTEAFGTPIIEIIYPRASARAKILGLGYRQVGTAHRLTPMIGHKEVAVQADAASGQAVVIMSDIPSDPAGTVMAANDYFILQYADKTLAALVVSSVSVKSVTFTTNLAQQVKEGTRAFYLGAPTDYPVYNQFAINTTREITGGDERRIVAVAAQDNWPILWHSDNATAAGFLEYLQYGYTMSP